MTREKEDNNSSLSKLDNSSIKSAIPKRENNFLSQYKESKENNKSMTSHHKN